MHLSIVSLYISFGIGNAIDVISHSHSSFKQEKNPKGKSLKQGSMGEAIECYNTKAIIPKTGNSVYRTVQ